MLFLKFIYAANALTAPISIPLSSGWSLSAAKPGLHAWEVQFSVAIMQRAGWPDRFNRFCCVPAPSYHARIGAAMPSQLFAVCSRLSHPIRYLCVAYAACYSA